eukprot:1220465-Pyramimonas_sp.AAC.1
MSSSSADTAHLSNKWDKLTVVRKFGIHNARVYSHRKTSASGARPWASAQSDDGLRQQLLAKSPDRPSFAGCPACPKRRSALNVTNRLTDSGEHFEV